MRSCSSCVRRPRHRPGTSANSLALNPSPSTPHPRPHPQPRTLTLTLTLNPAPSPSPSPYPRPRPLPLPSLVSRRFSSFLTVTTVAAGADPFKGEAAVRPGGEPSAQARALRSRARAHLQTRRPHPNQAREGCPSRRERGAPAAARSRQFRGVAHRFREAQAGAAGQEGGSREAQGAARPIDEIDLRVEAPNPGLGRRRLRVRVRRPCRISLLGHASVGGGTRSGGASRWGRGVVRDSALRRRVGRLRERSVRYRNTVRASIGARLPCALCAVHRALDKLVDCNLLQLSGCWRVAAPPARRPPCAVPNVHLDEHGTRNCVCSVDCPLTTPEPWYISRFRGQSRRLRSSFVLRGQHRSHTYSHRIRKEAPTPESRVARASRVACATI